jgi:signal transduction histidine kinase
MWLRIASNSTNLLLSLVNDTLDFYQIKSDKFSPQEGALNLLELVENCFDLLIIQMQSKGLQKIVEIDETLTQEMFLSDKQRLS